MTEREKKKSALGCSTRTGWCLPSATSSSVLASELEIQVAHAVALSLVLRLCCWFSYSDTVHTQVAYMESVAVLSIKHTLHVSCFDRQQTVDLFCWTSH